MKKKIAILVLSLSMLSLVGCGEKTNVEDNNNTVDEEQNDIVSDETDKEDTKQDDASVDSSETLKILQTVWSGYDENDRFAACGGDSHNAVMDEPGAFDITSTEELNSTLGFPADYVDKIDEAASLVHMLNANTFTAGAYHITDGDNVQSVADALKENILGRQWMCGFPEKLIVVKVNDNYVISAFGLGEQIETFKNGLSNAYENTEILYEESI